MPPLFEKKNIQDIYELSPLQEGMYFYYVSNPASCVFTEQVSIRMYGPLDVTLLNQAFNELVKRYDVLRTVFNHTKADALLQIVLRSRAFELSFKDIRSLPDKAAREHFVMELQQEDRNTAFDLNKDLLMRVVLIQLEDEVYEQIWSHHHIILDGWSFNILMKELDIIYTSLVMGRPFQLPEVKKYRYYIDWVKQQEKTNGITAVNYWRNYLEGYSNETRLLSTIVTGSPVYQAATLRFTAERELYQRLSAVAMENNVTLNSILQTVWGVLLSLYNDTSDVMFGTVISGRSNQLTGLDGMVGLFINTLPVRIRIDRTLPVIALVKQVQLRALENETYGFIPLSKIQTACTAQKMSVEHLFVFENYPVAGDDATEDPGFSEGETSTSDYSTGNIQVTESINYDFSLIIAARKDLIFNVSYNAGRYHSQDVREMKAHLLQLLQQVAANPDTLTGDMQLAVEVPSLNYVYPASKTIQDVFEMHVMRNPKNIAVTDGSYSLTYAMLNAYSNQLAHLLIQDYAITANDLAGVMMHRSVWSVVAIMGILKSGGGYVPLDPAYPSERLSFMMKDAGVKVIVTDLVSVTADIHVPFIIMEDLLSTVYSSDNPDVVYSPEDLAYIIYTSGSTGQPKGVMIEQRHVIQLLFSEGSHYDFDARDVWTLFHSISFDFSVWEIFGALLHGGKLVVVPQAVLQDPKALKDLIITQQVTVLNQIPSMFVQLIPVLLSQTTLPLRYVIFGGDVLYPAVLSSFHDSFPDIRLINMYGITETTVHVTFKQIDAAAIRENSINTGVPLPALRVCMLDSRQRLMPCGVCGEIAVSGAGVSRGYLNREQLTAERFITHPALPGERLYLSGDLGLLLHNGEIIYKGRKDHQVKMRGYRIETGEIESLLLSCPGVVNAAVIAKKDLGAELFLCAYAAGDKDLSTTILRSYLEQSLPAYMIPSYFIIMETLPVTSSGKTDRKALQQLSMTDQEPDGMLPPETAVEKNLFHIWQRILDKHELAPDVRHNFFDLGGHSIKAIRLVAAIEAELRLPVKISDIFKYPTIAALAAILEQRNTSADSFIERIGNRPFYPVSHGQKGLYLKRKFNKTEASFNMISISEVNGLNVDVLHTAYRNLLLRHESLRTVFVETESGVMQSVQPYVANKYAIRVIDAGSSSSGEISAQLDRFSHHIFDLHKGPLIGIWVIRETGDHYLVQVVIDHIICDALSMQVIERELLQFYEAALQNNLPALTPLDIQFKDYAAWQQQLLTSQAGNNLLAYWRERLRGPLHTFDMRLCQYESAIKGYAATLRAEAATHFKVMEEEELKQIEGMLFTAKPNEGGAYRTVMCEDAFKPMHLYAKANNCSLFSMLVTGLNLLIYTETGCNDILIGTPVSLRNQASLEPLIGWFLDTLLIRTVVDRHGPVKQLLQDVSDNIAAALDHRLYPMEKLLQELDISFDTAGKVFIHLLNFDTSRKGLQDFSSRHRAAGTPTFDINFTFYEYADGLELICDYRTALFSPEYIEGLTEKYLCLLAGMPAKLSGQISSAEISLTV